MAKSSPRLPVEGEPKFTKVKFDGQKVRLEYQIARRRGGEPDEYALLCADKPLPSFIKALQDLVVDVCAICEFPATEAPKFSVRGVSFSHGEDGFGACITALRALTTSDAPLIINSPFLPEKPRKTDPSGFRLPIAAVRRLKILHSEAALYLDGDRVVVATEAGR